MDRTDQLQFATAEILVGDKLIVDFPTEIGQTYIKLNSHGVVYLSKIYYLRIKRHKNEIVSRYGTQKITTKILRDWPTIWVKQSKPIRRSLKDQKLAAKKAARKERRLVKKIKELSADQK